MAAIDFPASPTANQLFSAPNGIVYRWQASPGMWVAVGASAPGGDFFAAVSGTLTTTPTTPTTLVVQTGNANGSFAPGTGRFTPPAGRFYIFGAVTGTLTTAATNVVITLRKNGTNLYSGQATSGAGNYSAQPDVSAVLDANGTDWFDIQVSANAGSNLAGWIWFGAYPISGIKGPQGDPGQLGWRLIGTQTVSSAVPQVDFTNLPSDINHLMFIASNWLPATNDAAPGLRFFDSTGTIDASANYATFGSSPTSGLGTGANVPATVAGSQSYLLMAHNGATNLISSNAAYGGVTIDGRIGGIRTAAQRKFITFASVYVNSAATVNFAVTGGGQWQVASGSIISGVRFLFNTGNIAAGTISLWGSP